MLPEAGGEDGNAREQLVLTQQQYDALNDWSPEVYTVGAELENASVLQVAKHLTIHSIFFCGALAEGRGNERPARSRSSPGS